MVRVRVRLGYTMAICLVLQHQVSPTIYDNTKIFLKISEMVNLEAFITTYRSSSSVCMINNMPVA